MNEIIQRLQAPTPSFFKKLRNIGLLVGIVATSLATFPITGVPAVIIASKVLAWVGTSVATVSQLTSTQHGFNFQNRI